MAVALTMSIAVQAENSVVSGNQTKSDKTNINDRTQFEDGTGASSVNKTYDTGTVTLGGSPNTYDLAGSLTAGNGAAASFTKIRAFEASAPSTNTGVITVGGGSNGWASLYGSTLLLRPGSIVGGKCLEGTAWAVTAGTGDIVQVSGTSGDKYQLFFAGE
jgi:hypothetical protein